MKIKTYRAINMQKGLMMVKDEMGPQAVILETRNVKVGGFFGLFAKKMVEIVAASDYPDEISKVHTKEITENVTQPPIPFTNYYTPIFKSRKLQVLYDILIKNELNEIFAASLIGDIERELPSELLDDEDAIEEKLTEKLGRSFSFSGPINLDSPGKVIFFVGPTGVGKTTTIAKIAAFFTLNMAKKVALISIDTFRIAAVEQLRTYAEILGISFSVVFTPLELDRAIKAYKDDVDLILIDTAGRSPKNELRMSELKGFTSKVYDKEVYLVLSVGTRDVDLKGAVEKFLPLNINSFIFTKLDESNLFFGNIFNLVKEYKIPVSYITFGQNVPDDIDIASMDNILRRCIYEYNWRSSSKVTANSN